MFRHSARMLFVALVATSACNAILDNEAKLSFDEEAEAGADGGEPASDGAVLGDRSEPAEGSPLTDSGSDADASGCDATFCSDFDPPLNVAPFGWSSLVPDAKYFATTASDSTTAPFALEITGVNAAPDRYLHLDLAQSGPASYSFDFRAVHVPAVPTTAEFFRLSCASGAVLALNFSAEVFRFVSGAESAAVPLPQNAWTRITILTETGTSSVVVNGQKHPVATKCLDPTKVELGLGSVNIGGNDSTESWRVRFDHVVIAF